VKLARDSLPARIRLPVVKSEKEICCQTAQKGIGLHAGSGALPDCQRIDACLAQSRTGVSRVSGPGL